MAMIIHIVLCLVMSYDQNPNLYHGYYWSLKRKINDFNDLSCFFNIYVNLECFLISYMHLGCYCVYDEA